MKDGVLHRGESDFHIRGFYAPDAAAGEPTVDTMAPALAPLAECGGNALAFDLPGLSEDGRKLSPEAAATVRAWAERAKEQRMAVLVNVLGGLEDAAARERAVKTAARALRNEDMAIYWIDGPDAAELTARFKKYAPGVVVASASGGDVAVVDAVPAPLPEGQPVLVRGDLAAVGNDTLHFLLDAAPEQLAAVEEKLTTDVERAYAPLDNSGLSEAERAEGYVPLFNGRDLSNWWVFGDNPQGFHVSDCGVIEWNMAGASALMSAKRYGDFILRLEYKIEPGGNSGVFLRAPRGARQSRIGMEFQIHGDAGTPPSEDSTGAVYMVKPALSNPARAGLAWNQLEIVLQGPRLYAYLNGELVQDLNLDEDPELKHRLRRGFIGLQDHDNYVCFRNVRIRELP